jgi:hypothetical protein
MYICFKRLKVKKKSHNTFFAYDGRIRIREAQKHTNHSDPGPQHCFLGRDYTVYLYVSSGTGNNLFQYIIDLLIDLLIKHKKVE